MSKNRNKKTNAARDLDALGIEYELIEYDVSHGFENGIKAAEQTGIPLDRTFKTLVTVGASGQHYVCVIPVARHLSLKRAAKYFGEKKIEMVKTQDIQRLTGYVHGGCSPIGMRKKFPTVIDSRALEHEEISVSAGRLGMSFMLKTGDLIRAADAGTEDVSDEGPN